MTNLITPRRVTLMNLNVAQTVVKLAVTSDLVVVVVVVVVAEAVGTIDLVEKCTLWSVPNVAKTQRCHSNHAVHAQFTAATVIAV
jgi:hypothetical protein